MTVKETINKAHDALNGTYETYKEGLDAAVGIFEDAVRQAQEQHLDGPDYQALVHDYADVLAEHWQFGPLYVARAEEYIALDLSLCEKLYGPRHERTGKAHRLAGNFYLSLDRFAEAAPHFIESAAVLKALYGEYGSRAGEDLSSAAYCYSEQGMYQRALDLNLMAYDISLKYPGNDYIHPQPLCFDISVLYRKLGNEPKCREFLDKYDEYEKQRKG
ncbi:MAG: tetratricopeptide repeat protein [Bacteroidales bacterium]|nr:tetratricopeptide repeat protein [Bacteroidales bacterium]